MQVKEVMSSKPEFLSSDATIAETARSMCEMNTEFVPIAENDQIIVIVTDRDLVLWAMADGNSLDDKIRSTKTPKVLYCAEDDDVKEVLKTWKSSMCNG